MMMQLSIIMMESMVSDYWDKCLSCCAPHDEPISTHRPSLALTIFSDDDYESKDIAVDDAVGDDDDDDFW